MAGERVNLNHVVFYRFLYVVRNIDKYMFWVHSKNAFLSKMKLSSDYEYIYAWKKIYSWHLCQQHVCKVIWAPLLKII